MRTVAIALALSLAAPAAAEDDVPARVGRAIQALQDEDVEAARGVVEPLLASRPDDPWVALAGGVLRLSEQRYDEAVALLERATAAAPGMSSDYLEVARAAREVTRDYASAESDHFVVRMPKGKDEVLAPYVLEALEAQRRALEEDLGDAPPGKVAVEILPSTRALARLSTLTEQEIRTSGTIAICKFNKLMVTSPKALLRGYDWLDTAAHEYVHYVVTRRTRNGAPIWLHEGIAKYEETRWRGQGGESLSPWSAALLKDAARRGALIAFAAMHPSMAKLPSQEAASLAFAEVMVAVEYLERHGGRGLMNRILDEIAGGRTAEQAVAAGLGTSFDEFLASWRRWIAARPLPQGGETELRRLRFKDDPKRGEGHSEWADLPDERARAFARLGEIFRERGRWEAARVEYGRAVKRVGAARHPLLADKFALAAMMADHDAEAEAALAEAAHLHPAYAALHVHRGRLHLKRKRWADARAELLLANRIDPFDPEIHAGLSKALEALGDAGGASRERRFAQMLIGHEAP